MHELINQSIFYIFAALTVFSATMVVTQNNPVRSVLFLVLAFFCSAGIWLFANAEFLSLILVLVYVGAVMTLFLFVVMMLDIDVESTKTHVIRYLPFGLILVAGLVALLVFAMPKDLMNNALETKSVLETEMTSTVFDSGLTSVNTPSNTEALGQVLYTDYVFPFELAAAILLVAIVAAITLVHRAPIRSKRQNVVDQIMVQRSERVKLVKIKSET